MGRTITVTIDEEGNQVFLKGHGADVFLGVGDTRTQRASHVEPDNPPPLLKQGVSASGESDEDFYDNTRPYGAPYIPKGEHQQ